MTSLLPPNATRLERGLEHVSRRATDVPTPLATLIDPHRCPERMLPWLAWHFSVDTWDPTWSTETKRNVIASSIETHRRKGTIGSIRRAIRSMGYGDATVIESFSAQIRDGSFTRDGSRTRVTSDHWAEYRVTISEPVTQDQAQTIRDTLELIAPARSTLKVLDFRQAAIRRNGVARRNGAYTRGIV